MSDTSVSLFASCRVWQTAESEYRVSKQFKHGYGVKRCFVMFSHFTCLSTNNVKSINKSRTNWPGCRLDTVSYARSHIVKCRAHTAIIRLAVTVPNITPIKRIQNGLILNFYVREHRAGWYSISKNYLSNGWSVNLVIYACTMRTMRDKRTQCIAI